MIRWRIGKFDHMIKRLGYHTAVFLILALYQALVVLYDVLCRYFDARSVVCSLCATQRPINSNSLWIFKILWCDMTGEFLSLLQHQLRVDDESSEQLCRSFCPRNSPRPPLMKTSITHWVGPSNSPNLQSSSPSVLQRAAETGGLVAVLRAYERMPALSSCLAVNNDPIHSTITASRPADRPHSPVVVVFIFHVVSFLRPPPAPDALPFILIRKFHFPPPDSLASLPSVSMLFSFASVYCRCRTNFGATLTALSANLGNFDPLQSAIRKIHVSDVSRLRPSVRDFVDPPPTIPRR